MNATKIPPIALNLPRIVALLIVFARHVVQAMTNNPWFLSMSGLLTTTASDVDALHSAEATALTRAEGAAAVRDVKRKIVIDDLILLKTGVQTVVNQNPGQAAAIVESAGMAQRKSSAHAKPNLSARMTPAPGVVQVRAKAVRRASYEWQYSTDGGRTWLSLGTTTVADTTVPGLVVGTTYQFRFRTTVKRTTSDWSPALGFFVT